MQSTGLKSSFGFLPVKIEPHNQSMSSIRNESFSGGDSFVSSDEGDLNQDDMSMNETYVLEQCQAVIRKFKNMPSKCLSTARFRMQNELADLSSRL